ncbi:oxidoreductase [Runella slithyformis]|uniref:Oxidoreductase domain protein n=1 Tax=Runella slithyformis (strain ATCC 29530 / DSM 19594 / LMG 11500 / NCIMB 11436 / LSU 4) TaxID=761193 RepID=A0A7U3ZQ34_RUNSL|nr:oxidoreductase [Runella slithyformis]AEI51274.1 oxidoreductase domain protein [Runella slithyformis DSM 19594]
MSSILNVGLIGFGLSGRYFHAPFLKVNPRFNLTKVVTRNAAAVHEFDPAIEIVDSAEALLADASIDLVFVCTPNDLHFPYAKAALEAGKHVVIEKPFTNTTAEADALISLAKEKNLIVSAYQNRRWDADFLTIQQLLQDGSLGDIIEFEGHFDRYRPEVAQGTWKEVAAAGAGTLYNLGPHLIDQALVLFGTPQKVTATIKIIRPGGETDDYFDIRLDYADKSVILKASLVVFENGLRYVIHGTKGSFIKSGLDIQEDTLRKNILPNTEDWGQEPESQFGTLYTEAGKTIVPTLPGHYTPFYDNIYEAIAEGKELIVKPQHARNTTRVMELAIESSQLGKTMVFEG